MPFSLQSFLSSFFCIFYPDQVFRALRSQAPGLRVPALPWGLGWRFWNSAGRPQSACHPDGLTLQAQGGTSWHLQKLPEESGSGAMVERTGDQRGGWTHSRGPASGPEDPPPSPHDGCTARDLPVVYLRGGPGP